MYLNAMREVSTGSSGQSSLLVHSYSCVQSIYPEQVRSTVQYIYSYSCVHAQPTRAAGEVKPYLAASSASSWQRSTHQTGDTGLVSN